MHPVVHAQMPNSDGVTLSKITLKDVISFWTNYGDLLSSTRVHIPITPLVAPEAKYIVDPSVFNSMTYDLLELDRISIQFQ